MYKLRRVTHRLQLGVPQVGLGEEGAADTGRDRVLWTLFTHVVIVLCMCFVYIHVVQ